LLELEEEYVRRWPLGMANLENLGEAYTKFNDSKNEPKSESLYLLSVSRQHGFKPFAVNMRSFANLADDNNEKARFHAKLSMTITCNFCAIFGSVF
jgi:hypothetical protein